MELTIVMPKAVVCWQSKRRKIR